MANKLHVIVQTMKKKKYNVLDARKDFFDIDFEEFQRSIDDLHVSGFDLFTCSYLLLINSLRMRGSRVGASFEKKPTKSTFPVLETLAA